jgi:predicted RNA binding protein YcfA (HicA-like mRNA interferase family)
MSFNLSDFGQNFFLSLFYPLNGYQGWQLLRINGSHHIYGKSDNPARISVPVHGNQSLKPGLLRHFLKVANLSEDDI